MQVTKNTLVVAATLGAAVVWALGVFLTDGPHSVLFQLGLIAAGGIIGVADLFLFSMIARNRGR